MASPVQNALDTIARLQAELANNPATGRLHEIQEEIAESRRQLASGVARSGAARGHKRPRPPFGPRPPQGPPPSRLVPPASSSAPFTPSSGPVGAAPPKAACGRVEWRELLLAPGRALWWGEWRELLLAPGRVPWWGEWWAKARARPRLAASGDDEVPRVARHQIRRQARVRWRELLHQLHLLQNQWRDQWRELLHPAHMLQDQWRQLLDLRNPKKPMWTCST